MARGHGPAPIDRPPTCWAGFSSRAPQIRRVIATVDWDDGTTTEVATFAHQWTYSHVRISLETEQDLPRRTHQVWVRADNVRANTDPPKLGESIPAPKSGPSYVRPARQENIDNWPTRSPSLSRPVGRRRRETLPCVWLISLGAVLQLIGLVFTFFGFCETWRQHGDGRGFFDFALEPVRRRLRRVRLRLAKVIRGLLRRGPRSTTVNMGATTPATRASGQAYLTVTPKALPDPTHDLSAFAAEVDKRFQRLNDSIDRQEHELTLERQQRISERNEIRREMLDEKVRIDSMLRSVKVEGLRLELVGWFLLFLGLLLSFSGSLF